jgi:hypothetical protein
MDALIRSGLVVAMGLAVGAPALAQVPARPGASRVTHASLVFTREYSPEQTPRSVAGLMPPRPRPPAGPCPAGGTRNNTTWGQVATWLDDVVFDYHTPFDTVAMAARVSGAMKDDFSGDLTPAIEVGRASAPDSAGAFSILHRWGADQGGTRSVMRCIDGAWVLTDVQNVHRRWSFGWMSIGPLTWGGFNSARLRTLLSQASSALAVPTG